MKQQPQRKRKRKEQSFWGAADEIEIEIASETLVDKMFKREKQ